MKPDDIPHRLSPVVFFSLHIGQPLSAKLIPRCSATPLLLGYRDVFSLAQPQRGGGDQGFQFRCVGGVLPWANQSRGLSRRQSETREHLFPSVHQNLGSALRRGHYGRARRRQSLHCAPRLANALQSSGCLASVSHRSMPSWSSSRRSGAAVRSSDRSFA